MTAATTALGDERCEPYDLPSPMKLRVEKITEEPQESEFSEPYEEVNARLDTGAHDFRLTKALAVRLTYYRAADDLVFRGNVRTSVEGTCARCLETFPLDLEAPLDVVLTPPPTGARASELQVDDLSLSTYTGDEIDLAPLAMEQAILALPTRALCRDDCRGLCPKCGVNRNLESCDCTDRAPDPRLAVLRGLKVERI
jgi:DUF177 domain-containing protein